MGKKYNENYSVLSFSHSLVRLESMGRQTSTRVGEKIAALRSYCRVLTREIRATDSPWQWNGSKGHVRWFIESNRTTTRLRGREWVAGGGEMQQTHYFPCKRIGLNESYSMYQSFSIPRHARVACSRHLPSRKSGVLSLLLHTVPMPRSRMKGYMERRSIQAQTYHSSCKWFTECNVLRGESTGSWFVAFTECHMLASLSFLSDQWSLCCSSCITWSRVGTKLKCVLLFLSRLPWLTWFLCSLLVTD